MAREKYTAQFKFDRVVETLRGGSVGEVARKHGFGVNLLSKWRGTFMAEGPRLFEQSKSKEVEKLERRIRQLEQLLGKKEVELSLIRNFTDFYGSQNGS